ncbi:hypothetical protein [Streptococcus macacae]|uniref:Membrane protein n=1 Tax=Streptococcus macacae NCTC 11558 TaxID=764298 RepID=G5JUI9_9STRE|nr:hypothetical protein [Streptococcus macacae]EHJ52962.1 putative membrane protein [Streptococcus macacae NCTC 11558]SUN78631.1 polysaccharide polymerase [Streptococcus macacae NCTC 11558]
MKEYVSFRGREIRIDELLFFLAFVPYLIIGMLWTTMFPMPDFSHAIAKAFLIFSFASVFFKKHWNIQFLAVSFSLLLIGSLVWLATSDTGVIALALLIMGAYKIDARKIIKTYLLIVLLIMILAFFSSMIGIIPNLQYVRPGSGIVRNSFGIIYPTDFAAHVLFAYLFSAYLYFEKKPWLFSGLGVLLVAFLIKFSDARLDAITLFLAILLFLLIRFLKGKALHQAAQLAPFSTLLAFLVTYALTIFYNAKNGFLHLLDNVLSGRLHLGKRAIEKYGLKPFGQVIKFFGNGRSTKSVLHYNFVDSSYLKFAFVFGLIFILFFVLLMTLQAVTCLKRQDYYTLAVIVVISINSMIAHHLIEPYYNIFAILFLANFSFRQVPNAIEKQSALESHSHV